MTEEKLERANKLQKKLYCSKSLIEYIEWYGSDFEIEIYSHHHPVRGEHLSDLLTSEQIQYIMNYIHKVVKENLITIEKEFNEL